AAVSMLGIDGDGQDARHHQNQAADRNPDAQPRPAPAATLVERVDRDVDHLVANGHASASIERHRRRKSCRLLATMRPAGVPAGTLADAIPARQSSINYNSISGNLWSVLTNMCHRTGVAGVGARSEESSVQR